MTASARKAVFITLGLLILLAGTFLLVSGDPMPTSEEQLKQYRLRIAVINRFVGSAYQQHIIEHESVPESWREYRHATGELAESLDLGRDFFRSNTQRLPGMKQTGEGDVENVRVWLLSPEEFELAGNYERSWQVDDTIHAEFGFPMVWIVYERDDRYEVLVGAEGFIKYMTVEDFEVLLEDSFAYAEENGIHYHPDQLDYLQSFKK